MAKNKGNKVNKAKGNKVNQDNNGQNTFGLTFTKVELNSKRAGKWNYAKAKEVLEKIAKQQGKGTFEIKPIDKFLHLFSSQDKITGGQARSLSYRLRKQYNLPVQLYVIKDIVKDDNTVISEIVIGKETGRLVLRID